MPGLAGIHHSLVREPNRIVLDEVRLSGLTKLIVAGFSTGLTFLTPDADKVPQEEGSKKVGEELKSWKITHKGPYPTNLRLSTTWTAQKLVTEEGQNPEIIQIFTSIRFELPQASKETYGELKERIERESLRMIDYMRKQENYNINAFYIGNLRDEWAVPDSMRQCMPICGDSFLDKPARDIFVPRICYDLSLFEIAER